MLNPSLGQPPGWYLSQLTPSPKEPAPIATLRHPRPSFTKLEQWLETLRMHLAGHLPLGPQLEQLDRGFWETYRRGESGLPAHPEVPD